jgi:hypothetical protein
MRHVNELGLWMEVALRVSVGIKDVVKAYAILGM